MAFFLMGSYSKAVTHIAPHRHSFYQIVLCTEGKGIIKSQNREYPYVAGRIYIIPPGIDHGTWSEGGITEIYINIDHPISSLTELPKNEVIGFDDDADRTLTNMMKMMLLRYIKGEKNDGTFLLMYDLFLHLVMEKYSALQMDSVVEDVKRLLAMNYNDPQLSLSKVLESTGYQKDHMRRRFIAECGITPLKYLTEIRIENAKRLIKKRKEMHLSVAGIGEMCGYYDGNYFSRVFKKHVGVSPEEYEKEDALES